MSHVDPEPDGLNAELRELIAQSRQHWAPTQQARSAEFQRDVHKRIRRRNARNLSLAVACGVALLAGQLLLRDSPTRVQPEDGLAVASAPQDDRTSTFDSLDAGASTPMHLVATAVDGPRLDLGPLELDAWFAAPLGAPPSPADLPFEYGALGALYLSEVL